MNDDLKNPQDQQNASSTPTAYQADSAQNWYQHPSVVGPSPKVPSPQAGSVHKEAAPLSEVMQPVEHMPRLSPELKDFGVEVPPQQVQLEPEHIRAGLTHAGALTQMNMQAVASIKLPMTEEEALAIKKNRPITDSIKWLAEYVLRQYKLVQKGGVKE